MKKLFAIILCSALALGLAGCVTNDSGNNPGSNSNVSDNSGNYTSSSSSEKTEQSSENSTNTSTGEQTPIASSDTGNTVLTAAADAHNSQTLYLWEEGNAPATERRAVVAVKQICRGKERDLRADFACVDDVQKAVYRTYPWLAENGQAKGNAAASDIVLTADEIAEIDRALDSMKMSPVFGGSKIIKLRTTKKWF